MSSTRHSGTVAVLASGGIDSTCLLAWAAGRFPRVQPLYVACGLLWEKPEWASLKKSVRALDRPAILGPVILRMPCRDLYGDMEGGRSGGVGHWSLTGRGTPSSKSSAGTVYLPGRNLMLLSKAAVYCTRRGITTLAIGTLAGNPFPDATSAFFSSFSKLASRALGVSFHIEAPFRRLTKQNLVRRYRHLPLSMCFSCLRPTPAGRPCGRCNKCAERRGVLFLTHRPTLIDKVQTMRLG